jgi:class 3 adenylate cyclase/tetratricopeptide (TPR) repeat protein
LQVPSGPSVDLSENRRRVTVLFADLSGSTTLGERLDPEDLRRILASFFSVLSREIQRYGGTVDKYIGDAVMAVFGAPVAHEDDPERAISAALAMQAAIGDLNDDLERKHGVRLSLRIGLNTGEVIAGLLAGDVQGAYTVVGDTVNTAQRFESAAPLGGILVSESTWRLTRLAFQFEVPTQVTLKGKAEPQEAYRVLARREREIELPATPLVGRQGELARLQHLMAEATLGRGSRVHVIGDAGVGKSRLLREFRTRLDDSVAQFVTRCASFETETPYAVVGRLLRLIFSVAPGADEASAQAAISGVFEDIGEDLDRLDTLLLLDLLGFGGKSGLDPQSKQRVLVSLLRRLLVRWADRSPLVIALEDMHWVDSACNAVLAELARDILSRRCLILTTSRPGWTPPWRTDDINLESLGEDSARAFVESVFGAPVDDALSETILTRTGGNPFFIEEVVHGLWESDVLIESEGRVMVQAGVTPRVPSTVQEVLTARLDRLPPSAKLVLQPAAVCGRSFWQGVIEHVLPGAPVTESIATLDRERFVLPRPVLGEPIYMFRHALIQEVAYQTQLQSQRRASHAAIGEAIETLYADRLDEFVNELAFHYRHSDNDPKALKWLVQAADRAKALYANQEALSLYAAALERAPDGEGPLEAGTILERSGDVQALIGRYDEAIASFGAARVSIPLPTPVTRARLERKTGTALRIKGAYAEAEAALTEARAALGDLADIESAYINLQVGQLNWRTGQYAAAREALGHAAEVATLMQQDAVLAEGLKQLGNVPLHAGDPREAVELFQRSRLIFEQLEDIAGIADIRLNLGVAYGRMGRWDECLAELGSASALFERIGDLRSIGVVRNNIGQVHRGRAEYDQAITAYEQAAQILSDIGYAAGAANALMGLGMARVEAGQLTQGRADLLEAEARFVALGRSMYLAEIHRSLAEAELAAGNMDAAAQAAQRSLDLARAANAPHEEAMTQRVLGQLALATGDRTEARRLLEASRHTLAEVGEAAELARTQAVLRELDA